LSAINLANCSSFIWEQGMFVPAAFTLILLSISVTLPRRTAVVLFCAAIGASLLRVGEISWHWRRFGGETASMVQALNNVKPGARISVVFPMPGNREAAKAMRSTSHSPSYALMFRQAVTDDFIAERGGQPIYFRDPPKNRFPESPPLFDLAQMDARVAVSDYIWGCNLDSTYLGYLQRHATKVSQGGICSLWNTHRP
jgi:hypothetical protein